LVVRPGACRCEQSLQQLAATNGRSTQLPPTGATSPRCKSPTVQSARRSANDQQSSVFDIKSLGACPAFPLPDRVQSYSLDSVSISTNTGIPTHQSVAFGIRHRIALPSGHRHVWIMDAVVCPSLAGLSLTSHIGHPCKVVTSSQCLAFGLDIADFEEV
jgi:hypothetical protein